MTIRTGFFNSVNGDRKYKVDDIAKFFSLLIANGVFPNPSTGLQVFENENMRTIIKPGACWINGYWLINDSDYVIEHDVADGVLSRIDRIVARWDISNRNILLTVKKGTPASSPVAADLERNANIYEIALADVYITNGAIQITQANITDLRLNTSLCGIVHALIDQVDTTTIFNQYQAWFNSIRDGVETDIEDWEQQVKQDFLEWFQTIQDILDGDIAANLAAKITNLEQDFASHQADDTAHGIGDKSQLLTTDKTTIVSALNELFTNVSNGKSLVGGAITDVDDSVVIPTDPTFNDLAIAIGQISTGKKWATGTGTTNGSARLIVTGLNFTPSLVLATITTYDRFTLYFSGFPLIQRSGWTGFTLNSSNLPYNPNNTASFGQFDVGFYNIFIYQNASVNWIAIE